VASGAHEKAAIRLADRGWNSIYPCTAVRDD